MIACRVYQSTHTTARPFVCLQIWLPGGKKETKLDVIQIVIQLNLENSNTNGDIKFVRIIDVFEFTGVTCWPLLTFFVQAKVDSINLFNGVHCGMCAIFQCTTKNVHDVCQLSKQFIGFIFKIA